MMIWRRYVLFVIVLVWGLAVFTGFVWSSPVSTSIQGACARAGEENSQRILSFSMIFSNNIKIVFVNLFGILTFGTVTLLNIFLNGFVLGLFSGSAYLMGMEPLRILSLTVPHFFEYTGLWFSGLAGFSGIRWFQKRCISRQVTEEIVCLTIMSVVMIFIAALIETTVVIR